MLPKQPVDEVVGIKPKQRNSIIVVLTVFGPYLNVVCVTIRILDIETSILTVHLCEES